MLSKDVLNVATPLESRGTLLAIVVEPSRKSTVPVPFPVPSVFVTLAEKITAFPYDEGFAEDVKTVSEACFAATYVTSGTGVTVGVGVISGFTTPVVVSALKTLTCPIDDPSTGSVVPLICVAISGADFPFAARRVASPATSADAADVPVEGA